VAEYHVENFGCRASRADGEAIAATLRHSGWLEAEAPVSADVVIVNTCSVTAEADRQARVWLRRVRRRNPQARVIVTGCYAQRAPQELASMPEVDAVIGNSHKSLVAEVARGFVTNNADAGHAFVPISTILRDDRFAHADLAALPFAPDSGQTRPNLKVQDGCGNRCSFCIIPTTRGHSRSVPLSACLDNVRRFVDRGTPAGSGTVENARDGGLELVLSGINLGRWGRDLDPPQRFEDLVAAILTQTTLPRLRLSSIEPMDWSPDLLALYREFATGNHPRLARHAHLPLQSGSDTILRRMHRRYRPWHYAQRLAAIRELMPDAAIGADVMIGFPGETDALFEESYRFIASQPFTYLHLFPFSARPGTPAWELHRQEPVPDRVVRQRMQALRELIAEKFLAFRARFLGQRISAVTIEAGHGETTAAVTDNFLKLTLRSPLPANRMVNAHVSALSEDGLTGVLPPTC
jgi:threonylcarbamoyladenosine tRNA methylthiotransferase MtaB